jgi:hypothetical protein
MGSRGASAKAEMPCTLLEAAHRHAQRGETYLATEVYFKLMHVHPRTVEGEEARQALLDLARRYEEEGKRYHARSIYDKVAAWPAAGEVLGSTGDSLALNETIESPVVRAAAEEAVAALAEVAPDRGQRERFPADVLPLRQLELSSNSQFVAWFHAQWRPRHLQLAVTLTSAAGLLAGLVLALAR